jgi:16S rRNA (uracil1498-N3)-methyltransferase
MHRFFLTPDYINGDRIHFPEDIAHQIRHVLRFQPDQIVTILDNRGQEFEVLLNRVDAQSVEGVVQVSRPARHEPRAQVHLYLGLAQREKFEWILQKCTEVGACAYTPLVTSRSVVQGYEKAIKKQNRWQSILREAAEQSGRGMIPTLNPPLSMKEAVHEAVNSCQLSVLAWEGEHVLGIHQVLAVHPLTAVEKPTLVCSSGQKEVLLMMKLDWPVHQAF